MSDPDDESLILELIRQIDSKYDDINALLGSIGASFDRSSDKFDASQARIEEAMAQTAASQKRFSDEIEALRASSRTRRIDPGDV